MIANIILICIALAGTVTIGIFAHLTGWELSDMAAASALLIMLFSALKWVARWSIKRKEREGQIRILEMEINVNRTAHDLLGHFLQSLQEVISALIAVKADPNKGNILRLEAILKATGDSICNTQEDIEKKNSQRIADLDKLKNERELP